MGYGEEILKAEVTDWLSPLEKIYSRQTKQLEEHHSNLRARDKALVEKAQAESIPKLVNELAQFSSSIRQLNRARKQVKATKDAEKQKLYEVDLAKLGRQNEVDEFTRRVANSEELKKDYHKFKQEVDKQFPVSLKDGVDQNLAHREFLYEQHGANFYRLQEAMGHRATRNMFSSWQSFINAEGNEQWQADYSALDGDPISQQDMVRRWFYNKELGEGGLNLDSKFIADKFSSSVDKALNTKSVMQNLQYTQVNLTAQEQQLDTRIDVAIGQLIDNPNALTFEIQTQILEGVDPSRGIDIAKSREIVANRLERLGLSGGLQQHELNQLKIGKLPIPYAGGTDGGALFKSDQIRSIQKAIDTKNNQIVDTQKAQVEATVTGVMSSIITDDLPLAKKIDQKNEALLLMERTIGTNNDTYRALEALDPSLQTADSYIREKTKYLDLYNGSGDILQREEEIKKIPQGRVRDELMEKLEETKTYLSSAGLPSTFEELQKASRDILIDATDGTLKRDSVLSENSKALQRWLTKKRLEFHLNAKDKIPNPKEAAIQAEKEFTEFRDSYGINVKDEGTGWGKPNPAVGILSPDIHGEFPRFTEFREAKTQNNASPSLYMVSQWTNNTHKIQRQHKTTEDLLNNSVLKVVNEDDVLGSFIEGDKLFYSPKVITTGMQLGEQPGYVLQKAVEKMIENKHPYVNRYGLVKKLELLKNAPDLKLKEFLKNIDNKNYVSQYNYRGVLSFTPKQLEQLMNLEISQNIPIVEK